MRSKSGVVGAGVAALASLLILGACFGLKAVGEDRTEDSARSATGGSGLNTTVAFTVTNALPTEIGLAATVDGTSGWNGLKPTDIGAFGGRKIEAGSSHTADLTFATARSRVPFTLTFTSTDGAALGSVAIDRDYLKETCTSVKQGKYTVKDCSQVNVWWFAPSSAFTESRILGSASSCPSSKNSIDLGEYTDKAGKKQQVKFTLSCSSTTGATTGRLTQTAVATN